MKVILDNSDTHKDMNSVIAPTFRGYIRIPSAPENPMALYMERIKDGLLFNTNKVLDIDSRMGIFRIFPRLTDM